MVANKLDGVSQKTAQKPSLKTRKKAYAVLEVAKYFIHLANLEVLEEGKVEGVTNLRLQKVLYFAQSNYLGNLGRALFGDDIEAWQYGPVIPKVYHAFEHFDQAPIQLGEGDLDFSEIIDEDKSQMQSIWGIYGRYSGSYLLGVSHSHLPWKEAFANPDCKIITKESIEAFYGPHK